MLQRRATFGEKVKGVDVVGEKKPKVGDDDDGKFPGGVEDDGGDSVDSEHVPLDEAELASLRADWAVEAEDVSHFYKHLRRANPADVGKKGVSSSAAAMA